MDALPGVPTGVRQSCGTAVCATHAVIDTSRIRKGALTGAPVSAEVRKVQYGACAEAHAPVPGTVAW
ncbi:hypothetical protein [Streptomyces sp. PU-14G]|uniref:hypothetical protein n=1 Tax=Streptomyces sp. PU-14G TaxID=2800808 RepID=UPI0034DDF03D